MSTPIARVKPSALTEEARQVLAMAGDIWRRMPMSRAAIVIELERFGLVETETCWQWSTRNSGAGRHVVMWRRAPGTGVQTQPGSKEPHATQAESRPDGQDQYLPSSQASSQTLGLDEKS